MWTWCRGFNDDIVLKYWGWKLRVRGKNQPPPSSADQSKTKIRLILFWCYYQELSGNNLAKFHHLYSHNVGVFVQFEVVDIIFSQGTMFS